MNNRDFSEVGESDHYDLRGWKEVGNLHMNIKHLGECISVFPTR